ncbi:MAG: prepilin-type N-terminal cleavage/methylation domain-containing protein [Thermodesulfovibrionales bacterium]
MKKNKTQKIKTQKGVTLIELLVGIAIFSIIIAGVYGVYVSQLKHTTREHRIAESEMELEIVKNFIERDIAMAGYGLADDYGGLGFSPVGIGATNSDPDTLTLMGTALGRLSRSSQGWSYIMTSTPTFQIWGDVREDVQAGDRVIYMEPNTKTLLSSGGTWLFTYPASPTTERGTLVYGLHTENSNFPYYAVEYRLGGNPPNFCANGTQSLLRAESKDNIPPIPQEREPILDCVLDFQIAFGLDTNEDGTIDLWDNGGVQASIYDSKGLRDRLKQVRLYILVQLGMRDPDFTYSNPDPAYIANPDRIWVGDSGIGTGREITLTTEQRRFRWRVISLSITPKNIR